MRERLDGESSVHFHVDWAATLEAGRERLAQGKTDLILLDLSLPDSHGMDTFRTIRSLAPQLPVVILTGRDDQELGFQTIHEGGQDFLVKGQATPQLMDKIIRYAVERKHAQAALLRSEERYRLLFETIPSPDLRFLQAHGSLSGRQPGSPRSVRVFQGGIPAERHPRPQHPRVRRSYLSLAGGE